MRRTAHALAPILVLGVFGAAFGAELRVIAPSIAGSSWDQLAHAFRAAGGRTVNAPAIEVVNAPGGGGTVGLAQFAASPDPDEVLVSGSIMLASSLVNRSPVPPDRLTPIARLAVEPFAVVVPAASPLRTLETLRIAIAAEPGKTSWGGGPLGGVDHVAAILFGEASGIEAARLNYVPFLTSAEAAGAIADEKVTAAILAYGEVAKDIEAGRLRILGIATEDRVDGIDSPTLREGGVLLSLVNWRGLLGKAGLSDERRARLAALAASVVDTPEWRAILVRKRWLSSYLGPERFAGFLQTEHARMKGALKSAGILKPAEK